MLLNCLYHRCLRCHGAFCSDCPCFELFCSCCQHKCCCHALGVCHCVREHIAVVATRARLNRDSHCVRAQESLLQYALHDLRGLLMRESAARHTQLLDEGLALQSLHLCVRLHDSAAAEQLLDMLAAYLARLPVPHQSVRMSRLTTSGGRRVPSPACYHAVIHACCGALAAHLFGLSSSSRCYSHHPASIGLSSPLPAFRYITCTCACASGRNRHRPAPLPSPPPFSEGPAACLRFPIQLCK
jgi:hypothetical protein